MYKRRRQGIIIEMISNSFTAPDLTGCGGNTTGPDEINSIDDYVQPLIDKLAPLPPQERVVLVGHSFGGLGLSLAMEKFPEKVSVAIFASAVMPNLANPPSSILLEVSLAPMLLFYGSSANLHNIAERDTQMLP
ncbi:hypothetical protein ACLOJK_003014 [Asimina triloba]